MEKEDKMNWIDVNEKLPENDVEVLALVNRGYKNPVQEIAYLSNNEWVTCMRGVGDESPSVSHWQSLPIEEEASKRNYEVKQIISTEPGWYIEERNGPEDEHYYEYLRIIGLYLIEITWEDGEKSCETFPITGFSSDIDLMELEAWRKREEDVEGFKTCGPFVYLPKETRGHFTSEKWIKR